MSADANIFVICHKILMLSVIIMRTITKGKNTAVLAFDKKKYVQVYLTEPLKSYLL